MAHTTIQQPPPLKLKMLDCLKREQFNQGNDLKSLLSVLERILIKTFAQKDTYKCISISYSTESNIEIDRQGRFYYAKMI